ncbi:MAG TPA: molybdopterin-dependent oxidoreductase, partial [Gammaproteobacteria bacterium]|nr:molybdopterin-dependent oxidoreductase [Gammaproteobacteria bacterium]
EEMLDYADVILPVTPFSETSGTFINVEPEYDTADPYSSLHALKAAHFVTVLSAYKTEEMMDYADVILPVTPFSETSGTFVNVEGRWQTFGGAVAPPGEARPGWKVLRVLGNFLNVPGFEYISNDEVLAELRGQLGDVKPRADNAAAWRCPAALSEKNAGLLRVSHVPIYAVDNIVRRAAALQQTDDARQEAVYINSALAGRLGLEAGQRAVATQGEGRAELPVVLDDGVPDGCVMIPSGLDGTRRLGPGTAPVELRPA